MGQSSQQLSAVSSRAEALLCLLVVAPLALTCACRSWRSTECSLRCALGLPPTAAPAHRHACKDRGMRVRTHGTHVTLLACRSTRTARAPRPWVFLTPCALTQRSAGATNISLLRSDHGQTTGLASPLASADIGSSAFWCPSAFALPTPARCTACAARLARGM